MNSTATELIKDPLFQLNALLWLAQPVTEVSEITPLLYKKGFTVYAIAPRLAPPPDQLLVAQEAHISMQQSTRPDVVLTREHDRRFAFAECKASSFGPTSSTSDQARALLVVAGPRAAEVLGLASGQVSASLLVFLIPKNDGELLAQTLSALVKELDGNGLPAGHFSVLGLSLSATDLSIVIDDLGSKFFALPSGSRPFMKLAPDTDPRPLYFIPYDPDVKQSENETALCKRILFERMQCSIVTAVGRAIPPTELVLESQKILNDAMFGMYDQWENPESARHMRKMCKEFMRNIEQTINDIAPGIVDFHPEEGWKISLSDEEQQESVLDALTHFFCEKLDLRGEPPPTLFDHLEDNGSPNN